LRKPATDVAFEVKQFFVGAGVGRAAAGNRHGAEQGQRTTDAGVTHLAFPIYFLPVQVSTASDRASTVVTLGGQADCVVVAARSVP